ncbi:unnamed protein product [Bursaphelenchus xylophilus]|uniref:(pine wood nematode) hypothetical protein n=1 Tax=Bursaphelenchus xylophilus TaxID=6326 RepID=A0A1I7S3G9_BURXY|nr:unnamed protein product [Bursaphelenchus xylophilus]CAG9116302.1 unnamed protein product [Bursaphelenchus xylophilus]
MHNSGLCIYLHIMSSYRPSLQNDRRPSHRNGFRVVEDADRSKFARIRNVSPLRREPKPYRGHPPKFIRNGGYSEKGHVRRSPVRNGGPRIPSISPVRDVGRRIEKGDPIRRRSRSPLRRNKNQRSPNRRSPPRRSPRRSPVRKSDVKVYRGREDFYKKTSRPCRSSRDVSPIRGDLLPTSVKFMESRLKAGMHVNLSEPASRGRRIAERSDLRASYRAPNRNQITDRRNIRGERTPPKYSIKDISYRPASSRPRGRQVKVRRKPDYEVSPVRETNDVDISALKEVDSVGENNDDEEEQNELQEESPIRRGSSERRSRSRTADSSHHSSHAEEEFICFEEGVDPEDMEKAARVEEGISRSPEDTLELKEVDSEVVE